jgi:hypothetical protein
MWCGSLRPAPWLIEKDTAFRIEYILSGSSSPLARTILIGQKCNLSEKALFNKAFSVLRAVFLTFCVLQLFASHRNYRNY